MKRFLCFCISIALIFAAVPPLSALASEEYSDDPYWLRWGFESFEEFERLLVDIWSIGLDPDETLSWWWGFNSIEQLLEFHDEEDYLAFEEAYREVSARMDDMPAWMIWGYSSLEEFLEEFMEEFIDWGADAGLPIWHWFGYDYPEELAEWFKVGVDEFLEAYNKTLDEYEQRRMALRIAVLEEAGGTPGIINVMFNGSFIEFENAVPELSGGVTFVPARPFFEAMGAAVSFDGQAGAIIANFADKSIVLLIGQDVISATQNGNVRVLSADAAPYIKDGVSYIPVRAASEALSLDVYWDAEYEAVVIIDADEIIAEIDRSFTFINRLLDLPANMIPDDGETYLSVLAFLTSMTVFNSLDGDKSEDSSSAFNLHTDGRSFNVTGEINLSEMLVQTLMDNTYDIYWLWELLWELRFIIRQQGDIEGSKVDIILNQDEDKLYIRAPLLSALVPDLAEDAWLAFSGVNSYFDIGGFGSFTEGLIPSMLVGHSSMGELVYSQLPRIYRRANEEIFIYREIMHIADYHKALFGDDNFINNEGVYTLSLTLDDLDAAAEEYSEVFYFAGFDLSLSVRTQGGEFADAAGKIVIREPGYSYGAGDTQYTLQFTTNRDRLYISYEVHEQNRRVILMEIDINTTKSTTPIPEAPPDGDTVILAEELFSAFY